MKVRDVTDNKTYEVPGANPDSALVAMFLTQVLHKHQPETITWDVINKYLPVYQPKIRKVTEKDRNGSVKHFRQLWRFMVEDGLIETPPNN